MNLREIRDEFIRRSGRYDLITEDGSDAGANFFIQSGARFLDRRSNLDATRKGITVELCDTAGRVYVKDCWLIHRVSCQMLQSWLPCTKVHAVRGLACVLANPGRPAFYAEKTERYIPDPSTSAAFLNNAPASAFDRQDMACHHIMLELWPRPTQPCTVRVEGCFYSEPLLQDEDHNVWSERFPDTLIKAALYQLEIFYRNTEGAQDWLNSIQLDLTDAEQLEVLAEIDGKDEMGL